MGPLQLAWQWEQMEWRSLLDLLGMENGATARNYRLLSQRRPGRLALCAMQPQRGRYRPFPDIRPDAETLQPFSRMGVCGDLLKLPGHNVRVVAPDWVAASAARHLSTRRGRRSLVDFLRTRKTQSLSQKSRSSPMAAFRIRQPSFGQGTRDD
jgi:hypothetical protein